MKNLTKLLQLLLVPAFAMLAPLAGAATYTGNWFNRTFETEGALTIDFEIQSKKVVGTIDFDGPVFGGGDPPAVPLNAPLSKDGSGSFLIEGTAMGDLAGSFDSDGTLEIIISNIPGGFLTEVRINGQFDLEIERFTATYEIDNAEGLFAEGDAVANVPQKPKLKVSKNVKFSGNTGKTKATVVTNTGIESFKAKASGAKVMVKGDGPYKIIVKKAKKKVTRVKITVVNEDGFKARKTVKFTKE